MDLDAIPEEQPGRCDPEVYKSGTMVLMTHTIRSWMVEAWVKEVREASGEKVDWHMLAGRACVLAVGDLEKVHETVRQHLPLLRRMWKRRLDKGDVYSGRDPKTIQIALAYPEPPKSQSVFLEP